MVLKTGLVVGSGFSGKYCFNRGF